MANNDESHTDITNSESSSSLEHALLESLFYNEMMMMDDSAPAGLSDFMTLLGSDVGVISEKDILKDFGVSQNGDLRDCNPGSSVQSFSRPLLFETDTSQKLDPTDPSGNSDKESGQKNLLISQFAVLAGRLGISLPSDVLSSLSRHANTNDTVPDSGDGEQVSYQRSLQALSQLIQAQSQLDCPVASNHANTGSSDEANSSPEKLDGSTSGYDVEDCAEAAIASVTETRKRTQGEAIKDTKAPLYSKRRKKPRLADCESKLASLKAENETLKRHLDTITNQSNKFDEERKAQEQEMKRLMHEGAGPEQLNPLLNQFSEVYSDYGDNRHKELTFHLQQLQRLVAPTNFTKMGLWTLGQNERFYTDIKRNPIAGILREELRITSQQGRKILEQSQKIRDLSENLKECLRLLGKLKSICEHKQKVFSDRMSKCQEILTPLQVVKLLLWVDDNSNILESTCPGWGSERIHSRAKKESS